MARFLPLATSSVLLVAFQLVSPPPASADWSRDELSAAAEEVLPEVTREYRWFHQNPELSLEETKTAAHLAEALERLGLEVHTGIGGHGIVAILRSEKNAESRVVLYRADMDGLPVKEETGLSYASANDGVMHACGHDTHMASAVGALSVLAAHRDRWEGTVLFVGQPAEELGLGARRMLADRKFKQIVRRVGKPAVAIALHDASDLPAGQIAILGGYTQANVDSVDVRIYGEGGHGAKPEHSIDPVVIAADAVMSMQTIVSRRISGSEPAVITVGQFTAGTKHNIIPGHADLKLTVRSYGKRTRKLLLREITRVVDNVARAHGAPKRPKVVVDPEYTPAQYNDPEWTKVLRAAFEKQLGASQVVTQEPSMGGEDFGMFGGTLKIPSVMWRLGGANRKAFRKSNGEGLPGLHSPKWAPEVGPTLSTGVITATRAILTALEAR